MSGMPRSLLVLLLALVALLGTLSGCGKDCSDEYDRGFAAGKAAGREEGREEGREQGYKEGFGSRPSSLDSRIADWIFDVASRLGAMVILFVAGGFVWGTFSEYESDDQRGVAAVLAVFSLALAVFVFLSTGVYTAIGRFLEQPAHDGVGAMLGFAGISAVLWAVPVVVLGGLMVLAKQPGLVRIVPGFGMGLLAILWPLFDLAIHASFGTLFFGSEILAGALALLVVGGPILYFASESGDR